MAKIHGDIKRECRMYDAMAKSLLARKEVLANILKYTVKEFKDYSVPEIVPYLSGEPEIGTDAVDDYDIPHKIDAAGSETVSAYDGIRTFDIKFKVKIPGDTDEAELIINVESQNKYNPGYTLEKRGIYYLSRLISSQYDVEFTKSNFDKLKKCYSIWICTQAPREFENTVTEYKFTPENIVGNAPDYPQRYDLMSLVMVNLGSKEKNYSGLIKMLDTLLIELSYDTDNALSTLETEFQVPINTISGEEVLDMCNLSQGIYEKGKVEGQAEGKIEGKAEGKIEGRLLTLKEFVTDAVTYAQKLISYGIDEQQYNEIIKKYPELKPDFDVKFS